MAIGVFAIVSAALLTLASVAPSLAALRVVRYTESQPVEALDRSVSDAAAAQRLYGALISLPVAQPRWCAIGYGIGYRLTFSDSSRTTLAAKVESDGCREAILPGNDRRATNASFWAVFAATLRLDAANDSRLFPLPRLTTFGKGPHAPVLRDRFAPRRQ